MNTIWKKRMVQGSAVALSLMAMTTTSVLGTRGGADASLAGLRTAGIVTTVSGMEAKAYANADVQKSEVTTVAAAKVANPEWENRLMANVDEFLYVRAAANPEADIVGKMRKGDVADVTGEENGWYQISSGNVTGFVSADYCVVGDDAFTLASTVCKTYAKANEGGIRIRKEANADAAILTVLAQGDVAEVNTEAAEVTGWVAVISGGTTGYVSGDYVTVSMKTDSAITIEEEQEAIAAQKAQEEAKRRQAVATQNAAIAASCDETTLLAALIQSEAGNECYEGQVAVGAVVVNRVRSGGYPGSVQGVVYQSGQFTPAGSGRVAAIAAAGPKASCMQAAAAALSGYDNTGGCLSFRPVSSGRGGVVIGNHVFF